MADETVFAPLPWHVRLKDISEHRGFEFSASDEQRVQLADALGVASVEQLTVTGRASVSDQERVLVKGQLRAVITQQCVVSFEPVSERIDDAFSQIFWPAGRMPKPEAEEEVDPFDDNTPEPYQGDRIDLGQLIYELIASSLDPYPRADDVALERTTAGTLDDEPEEKPNPFAVLSDFVPKKGS